jgi:alpha-L-fucosidase
MNIIKLTTLSLALTASICNVNAQDKNEQSFVHEQSEASDYVWPEDHQVLQNLKHWQDQKFGVLMHWGLYSKAGIVESWSICSEDWIRRERFNDYEKDKQWYWSLKDSLNPVKFNPDLWADVMKKAGMKYMIFTTKHHDGFCMFDSKYTDFSIANGPFANNPRKNVAKEVFDAYRKQGFMIGCYFSKPDWHSKWFWNPYYATPRRGINYSIKQHPDWWQNYVKFTQNQLSELTTDYGKLDFRIASTANGVPSLQPVGPAVVEPD